MLVHLRIENFALIDRLELEFYPGLNILTGETGAGKSILLDALDAALGGKVSGRVLRAGEERAVVEATFATTDRLEAWLAAQEIEPLEPGHLLCSREITSRTNRTRVNGAIVNRQQMQELREQLLEITAQGQAMTVGREAVQRDWLDAFGGSDLLSLRQTVAQHHAAWQALHAAWQAHLDRDRQSLQRLDLLQFQWQELDRADLDDPDELERSIADRDRLAHSVDLKQQSCDAYRLLYQNDEGDAAGDLLGQAERILSEMATFDPAIAPLLELVTSALTQVEEAGRQLAAYGDDLDTDPDTLAAIEERIVHLKAICRKYGPTLADAMALRDRVRQELDAITQDGRSADELEAAAAAAYGKLQRACVDLRDRRRTVADALEAQIVAALAPLGMEKVRFRVELDPSPPSATGADRVVFTFSPNPGEPLQPLAETASGGEMSRFLLALRACLSRSDPAGTLVFDEIDAGVSGRVAQAIAQQLYELSRRHQVLCVTHQPIVAAIADRHFRVTKFTVPSANGSPEAERTRVRVDLLDRDDRREELALLAAGVAEPESVSPSRQKSAPARSATPEAIAFADALLDRANSLKGRTQAKPTKSRSRAKA